MVEYIKEGKIISILGCSEDEKEIIIPEFIDDLPVAKIAENSFNELKKLKRVVLPKNLRLIGSYAFAGCPNLEEVVLSEGLEVIDDWAFISCNISSLNIPSTVKQIGPNAFMGNAVKFQVNEFIAKKGVMKKKIKPRKYNAAVFPIGLLDSMQNLTNDIITERSRYYAGQVEQLEEKSISSCNLDVPFLFDGDEFLVALHSPIPLSNPSVCLAKESQEKIGKYADDDPDFLVLDLNIMSENTVIGELIIKTPYLENVEFDIVDVYSIEERMYRYYIHMTINVSSFGTGNVSREFAMDQFKELEGKYFTQLQNGLITEEIYDEIKNEIDDVAIDTLKSFLKQLDGVPVLQYLMSVMNAFLMDEELDDEPVIEFITEKINNIYDTLGDFQSFEDVCFSMKDANRFINQFTNMTQAELKHKYGVYIQDDEGKQLSVEEIANYRAYLLDNDFNYNLHADFLNYIYQLMSKLNQEYAMKTYQE